VRDALEKRKKYMHYELDDFCHNILINIKNKEFKLTNADKEIIYHDIQKVLKWLKEKSYEQRDDEEYEKITDSIKKQYGVLILKGTLEKNTVKDADSEYKDMTTIYGNEEEEDEEKEDTIKYVFDDMEETENGFKGMTEPEKAELKELKQAINDLCYSIMEIIAAGNINLSKEHIAELKDYIDDSLLWLHVHEKPSKIEYKMKIDEINEQCNKIFNYYMNDTKKEDIFKTNDIVSNMKNKRDELENLCLVLKLLINDGAFPLNKQLLTPFENKLEETIKWIYESDELKENNKLEESVYYNDCADKLIEINKLCDDISQKIHGVNIDENRDIFGDQRIIMKDYNYDDNDNDECGTSILDIVRKKQEDIINDMINEDN
jgi:hypothetical protein